MHRVQVRLKPQSDITSYLLGTVDETWLMPDANMPGSCAIGRSKAGKTILILTQRLFLDAPVAVQEEMLRHEAGHLTCGHPGRCGDRHPLLWNLATDGVVNHLPGLVDLPVIDQWQAKALGAEPGTTGSVTFEWLGIPPCPAEVAYELLKQRAASAGSCACGREALVRAGELTPIDLTEAQMIELTDRVATAIAAAGGEQTPPGRPMLVDLPPPEAWIQQAIELIVARVIGERKRTWRREHRRWPELLPGRGWVRSVPGCLFLVDASGSIDTTTQLAPFVGTIAATPELDGSRAQVFSDHLSPIALPVNDVAGIAREIATHGGGTLIRKVAELVRDEPVVVWLTDAESFDGLPEVREDWIWVVSRGGTIRVTMDPAGP